MRKVFVSTLVLSLCIGLNVDVVAKRKSTRAAKRTVVRAGRSTTSTSSSSSSKTTTVADSTHRFVADSAIYEQKLEYGVKYDLATMLLPSVSDYYKTNGSEAINEQLCFGPYMTLTGISTSGDIVEYTADGAFECQNLLSGYSYTLQLKEATKTTLATFAFPRRVKIVRSGVDVNYMQFEYEPYVDISEFVPKIATAVMNAKTSCQAFYDDMEKLKGQLGWTTGFSGVGTALSAGATGVGVLNVMKTNEVDRKLTQLGKPDMRASSGDLDGLATELETAKTAKDTAEDKLKSAREKILTYDENVLNEKANNSPECVNKKNFDKAAEKNPDFCANLLEENKKLECYEFVKSWELDSSSEEAFKSSIKEKKIKLDNDCSNKKIALTDEAKKNPWNYCQGDDCVSYNNQKDILLTEEGDLNKAQAKYNTADKKNKLENQVTTSVKNSRTLDKVQMGLNIGSAVTSVGSLALSVAGIKTAESALSNLKECESKISELKLLYNTYKAELEDNGVGEE